MTNGRVIHYGKWAEQTKFSEGDQVQLNIDQERRLLNARSHSAGHLLDNVVQDLGLAWVPGKGLQLSANLMTNARLSFPYWSLRRVCW